MNLIEIRKRLVAIIESARTSEESVYSYPVRPYEPPAWVVGDPDDVFYNTTLGDGIEVIWPIHYVVSTVDGDEAHRLLDLAREADNPVRVALQATYSDIIVERSGRPYPVGEQGEEATQLAVDLLLRVQA